MRNDYVRVTIVDLGFIHSVDLVFVCRWLLFMVRCLAGVEVALDHLDVVGVELHSSKG